MTSEQTITAAIIGELVPELEHASPILLERWERGEPLLRAASPTDVGFETGAVDSVLLELFNALVPYVKTILGWGVLSVIQMRLWSEREERHHAELVAAVRAAAEAHAQAANGIVAIAEAVARRDGTAVSTDEVIDSIARAASRLGRTEPPEV